MIDVEKLEDDAWEQAGSLSLYADHNDRRKAVTRILCALVLEKAAEVCSAKVDPEWPGDDVSMMAESCASDLRQLAQEVRNG